MLHSDQKLQKQRIVMGASGDDTRVDTRALKNGLIRLRFRLSPTGLKAVETAIDKALSETGYPSEAAALDVVCMEFQSGHPDSAALVSPSEGVGVRRLFKLFPDQYENVRAALNLARAVGCTTDAQALIYICQHF